MSAGSRRKGGNGEREVVDLLRAHGWTRARRNFGSGSAGGGDIVDGPGGMHLEVKRQERLNVHAAMRQAIDEAAPGYVPTVAHRRSRGGWLVTLPLDDLLDLLEELGR